MTTTRATREDGFMMAAVLVAIAVMMVAMSTAMPAWQTAARREREAELIFRGKQYGRAIGAFQRKYGGAFPPTVDVLINERFLRKKYKDPITGDDFVFVTPGSELPTTSTIPGTGGTSSTGRSTSAPSTSSSSTSPNATFSLAGGRAGFTPTAPTTTGGGTASGTGTRQTTTSGTGTQAGATTGIMAVYSKSKDKSFRLYNGLEHYNEWIFTGTQVASQVGSPTGGQIPGGGARGGAAGGRGGAPTGGRGANPQGGRGGIPQGGRAAPAGGTFNFPGGIPGRQ